MKTLEDYLYFKKIKHGAFAKIIGVTNTTISSYINGRTRISRKLAVRISNAIQGEISAQALLDANPSVTATYRPLNELVLLNRIQRETGIKCI